MWWRCSQSCSVHSQLLPPKNVGLSDINENEVVVHNGGQDFCNQCDQQVIVQTSLKTHEVVHEGVKYLADQCDYQF